MDYSEKWGDSVDTAVNLALQDLKLSKDQVKVTVLEEPSKGFFGIGSRLAKVRVEKKTEENKEIKNEIRKETKKEKEIKEPIKVQSVEKEVESECPPIEKKEHKKESKKEFHTSEKTVLREKPKNLVEITEHPVITFLEEIAKNMGLPLEIKASANEESLYVEINGEDSGTIIGKRGQTLDAIQYLCSLVANKNTEKYIRVVIDAENYREKREKTLEQLANRLADKVRKTGKNVRLEPMNPYERKVIHATLQGRGDVTTRSEGEEPYRRVIIELMK